MSVPNLTISTAQKVKLRVSGLADDGTSVPANVFANPPNVAGIKPAWTISWSSTTPPSVALANVSPDGNSVDVIGMTAGQATVHVVAGSLTADFLIAVVGTAATSLVVANDPPTLQ